MWHILRVLEGYPRKAEFILRGAYIPKEKQCPKLALLASVRFLYKHKGKAGEEF